MTTTGKKARAVTNISHVKNLDLSRACDVWKPLNISRESSKIPVIKLLDKREFISLKPFREV